MHILPLTIRISWNVACIKYKHVVVTQLVSIDHMPHVVMWDKGARYNVIHGPGLLYTLEAYYVWAGVIALLLNA